MYTEKKPLFRVEECMKNQSPRSNEADIRFCIEYFEQLTEAATEYLSRTSVPTELAAIKARNLEAAGHNKDVALIVKLAENRGIAEDILRFDLLNPGIQQMVLCDPRNPDRDPASLQYIDWCRWIKSDHGNFAMLSLYEDTIAPSIPVDCDWLKVMLGNAIVCLTVYHRVIPAINAMQEAATAALKRGQRAAFTSVACGPAKRELDWLSAWRRQYGEKNTPLLTLLDSDKTILDDITPKAKHLGCRVIRRNALNLGGLNHGFGKTQLLTDLSKHSLWPPDLQKIAPESQDVVFATGIGEYLTPDAFRKGPLQLSGVGRSIANFFPLVKPGGKTLFSFFLKEPLLQKYSNEDFLVKTLQWQGTKYNSYEQVREAVEHNVPIRDIKDAYFIPLPPGDIEGVESMGAVLVLEKAD
jgi:hypothetical protein